MTTILSPAFDDYAQAFEADQEPFVFFHSFREDGVCSCREFTRGEFWELAQRAAGVLREAGLGVGDCYAGCFNANHPYDLAFRLAAAMTGAVPVTINWQADTADRFLYKVGLTEAKLVLNDPRFPQDHVQAVKGHFPGTSIFPVEELPGSRRLPEGGFCRSLQPTAARMVVFTSGTTAQPKGVELSYRAYQVNRLTFEQFLEIKAEDRLALLVVNPLHHSNSSAMTDWAMRRPNSHIHLVEKYSTGYWRILAEVTSRDYDRLIAPTVSRHFDFLENLEGRRRLPLPLAQLKNAMGDTDFLIGSAPVGPTTIKRLQQYTGRLPLVRFGSTETCLQVIGTPHCLSEQNRVRAFERGWEHAVNGQPQPGYYIGRPHPPFTEARVVKAVDPGQMGYMEDCPAGQAGYLVTRGGNLMSGYVKDPKKTLTVFREGWYTGLEDICFTLENEEDGLPDYYWVSRESTLLIRGGANYAYDQINAELAAFVSDHYHLPRESFDIAVVGLKVGSEHEDSCCVTIELKDEAARSKQPEMMNNFLEQARRHVSKGAKPDFVNFAPIPRNFKGAVLNNQLADQYRQWLQGKSA